MFARLMQHLATRNYIRTLPRKLAADYGYRGPYTSNQVTRTMARHGIWPASHRDLAIAIFCDPDEMARLLPPDALNNLRRFRQSVANSYFGGDASFSADMVHDVARSAESHSDASGGEHGGHGGLGYSDHGGGGGGHL
jgi:hypothetical protein